LKSDYAKFELDDPPLVLALQPGTPALSHMGIRVASTKEVDATAARLRHSGLVTFEEHDTACCG